MEENIKQLTNELEKTTNALKQAKKELSEEA